MRLEWPTLALIGTCYGSWLLAGFWIWPVMPGLALAIMAVTGALHSSLVHECLHGHPTRNRLINEALVTLPLSLLHPFRRYKATHLAHHHDAVLTDPLDDPESYYRARYQVEAMPMWLRHVLRANNTLLGRIVMGPWLAGVAFVLGDWRLLRDGDKAVRQAWLLHIPAAAVVLALVWAMGLPIWLYVLGVCWPALSLISLRTFAEHRWHETPEGRTIIVEHSPMAWLFLFNNLHCVHHQLPSAPWYALPDLYAARRDYWQALNQGYVFPNYWALWRRWGVVAKEPVVHPAWRTDAGDAL